MPALSSILYGHTVDGSPTLDKHGHCELKYVARERERATIHRSVSKKQGWGGPYSTTHPFWAVRTKRIENSNTPIMMRMASTRRARVAVAKAATGARRGAVAEWEGRAVWVEAGDRRECKGWQGGCGRWAAPTGAEVAHALPPLPPRAPRARLGRGRRRGWGRIRG